MMWEDVGVIRSRVGLERAVGTHKPYLRGLPLCGAGVVGGGGGGQGEERWRPDKGAGQRRRRQQRRYGRGEVVGNIVIRP